jgi:hypothetical protein
MLSPEHRLRLARKGQRLYRKSCRTPANRPCAESFALHKFELGNRKVVGDMLHFLEEELSVLRADDPDKLLPMAEALIARIRALLEGEP